MERGRPSHSTFLDTKFKQFTDEFSEHFAFTGYLFFKKKNFRILVFWCVFFLIILFVVVVLVVCLFVFSQNSTSAERHQFLLFHSPMLFQDYSSTRVCVL